MATAKKVPATRKRAPKRAAQIHQERIGHQIVEAALHAGENAEITDVSEWKKGAGRGQRKLKLPSGNVCLARNPGLMYFVENGMLPNGLLKLITDAMNEGKPPSAREVKGLIEDGRLGDMLALARTVTVHSVISPKIHPVPEDEADRDEDLLYADEIDEGDMMFVFNWVVGGTHDLERFRDEQAAVMADLSDS